PAALADPAALEAAARGVDAVFASGTAHHVGPDGEARHGRNLAAAASAAGTPHLGHVSGAPAAPPDRVYASGDGAAPDSPLPLFRAKWEVEQGIGATGVAHTILAPPFL